MTIYIRYWRTKSGKKKKIRLYGIWGNMLGRCSNPNLSDWKYYGMRGITVCNIWNDFTKFRSWAVSNGYRRGLTIDRIDNDGNYTPKNCRWVDQPTQMKNRRWCVAFDNAVKICMHVSPRRSALEEFDISSTTYCRIRSGEWFGVRA